MKFYKGARPDGWDFYTGNTINFRENIGKTVTCPKPQNIKKEDWPDRAALCSSTVIHASQKPNGIFVGSKIPCSVYIVKGKPVIKDPEKAGFKALKIIEEIPQQNLDALFGWKYTEVCNSVHPFRITPTKIAEKQITLLKQWDSVWASVGASVWDSVGTSVGASVEASVWAYIGSLFPGIKKWMYVEHKEGKYPFQSAADLWRQGLVPSFDGQTWRLHGGENAAILFEISQKELMKR